MYGVTLADALGDWRQRRPTLSASLHSAIADAILDGRLARGMPLPSERALALALKISRVTVSAAYASLREEGWVNTTRGAGSEAQLPQWLDARIDEAALSQGELIDLTRAAPGAPLPAYLDALGRAGELLPQHALMPVTGTIPGLRDAIADRYSAAGVPTRPDEILATAGARAGLMLLTRYLARPGGRVLVESPTYPGALGLLRSAGLRPVGWPMATGWDVGLFEALLRKTRPAAAYLLFDFHNPTGALAPAQTRRPVLRAARALSVPVILDETMCALDLRGGSSPPMTVDGKGVYRIGSLAKAVWAGLRIGWVRASVRDVDALGSLAETYCLAPPPLEQLIALELFGRFDELVAARRVQLTIQLRALLSALEQIPGVRLTQVPAGGLTTWIELPAGVSSADATRTGVAHGLGLLPGGRFSPDGMLDRFLRIPFSLPEAPLREACHRLGGLLGALQHDG